MNIDGIADAQSHGISPHHSSLGQGTLTLAGDRLSVMVGDGASTSNVEFFNASKSLLEERLDKLSYMEKYHVVKGKLPIRGNIMLNLRSRMAVFIESDRISEDLKKRMDDHYVDSRQRAKIDHHFAISTQQYMARRHEFAFEHADLKLHWRYKRERNEPHFYPDTDAKVRYPDDASEQKAVFRDGRLDTIVNLDGTTSIPGESGRAIFVRSNSSNSIQHPQTYLTEKYHTLEDGEEKLSHHSSFKRGGNVISAGVLKFDQNNRLTTVVAESGHYRPNRESLYKFAEFGAQTGQFDPDKLTWVEHTDNGGARIRMNQAERMKAVLSWAKRHPLVS